MHHGVAGTEALRLMCVASPIAQNGLHLVGITADNHDWGLVGKRLGQADAVFDQWPAGQEMQHLWGVGAHAGAIACG